MYYYADCAPSGEASFAIGNVSFLPSFLAALWSGTCSVTGRSIMPFKFLRFFSAYHTECSTPQNNEVNKPISYRTDWDTGLRA